MKEGVGLRHEASTPAEMPAWERYSNESPLLPEEPAHRRTLSAEESVSLGSLSLRESINLEWNTAQKLAAPFRERVATGAYWYGAYTPAVAEAVTHIHEPETQFIGPTAEQIKKNHLGLRMASKVLGLFSDSWGNRFDRYIEQRARQKIVRVARRVTAVVDTIGGIQQPKAQFVHEVSALYQRLQHANAEDVKSDIPKSKGQFDKTVMGLVIRVDRLFSQGERTRGHWFNGKDFPLLAGLAATAGSPHTITSKHINGLLAASPEVMRGMEHFLYKHGAVVQSAEFAPYRSVTRRLMQRFRPERLERVPHDVEAALTSMYTVLPENGEKFAQSIYGLCKKITEAARHGLDGRVITKTLLKDLWR